MAFTNRKAVWNRKVFVARLFCWLFLSASGSKLLWLQTTPRLTQSLLRLDACPSSQVDENGGQVYIYAGAHVPANTLGWFQYIFAFHEAGNTTGYH